MSAPTTFAALKAQQKETKKSIILHSAIRVFSQKSLHKASLRDIAEEAGISHASIYRYFQDKQSLFVQAFLLGVQELSAKLDHILHSHSENDILQITADTLLDYLNKNEHYFTMMTQFMLEGGLSSESVLDLNLAMRSFLDKLEKITRIAGGKSHLRHLAHTFFACINGILITFHNYPGRSKQELQKHMQTLSMIFVQMFRDGLATENYKQHIPAGSK